MSKAVTIQNKGPAMTCTVVEDSDEDDSVVPEKKCASRSEE